MIVVIETCIVVLLGSWLIIGMGLVMSIVNPKIANSRFVVISTRLSILGMFLIIVIGIIASIVPMISRYMGLML